MSETKQPDWELVANLGDLNAADYGTFLVYRDKTGVYAPQAEVYETDETGNGGTMYRFALDPPRFKTFTEEGKRHFFTIDASTPRYFKRADGLEVQVWYRHSEWFVEKLPEVASSCGNDTTALSLLRDLFSKNPVRRGVAYRDIVGYFGLDEFDSYPVSLTEEEAQARYADIPSWTRNHRNEVAK